MHPQPQPADPLHHRRNGPPDGRDLRGEHVRLLGAHPLRGAPAQSQHKGRDPRLGHHLFQNLPHRHLAVQDGRVSADDLDIHISHSHKVPHAAAPGILHGPGPLSCQHPAPLLRLAVSAVPAGDGEAQAAASLPVNPDGVVDLHQDIRQKREPPQKGHAIGAVRLRIQRREQQQVLTGQRPHPPLLVGAADCKCQGMVSLPNLNILHPAPQHGRNLPVPCCGHDLPDGSPAGQQSVQVALQKGIDPILPPSGRDRAEEFPQPPLCRRVGTGRRHTAHHPDQLVDGGVHHRHRFPHSPVQPRLSPP